MSQTQVKRRTAHSKKMNSSEGGGKVPLPKDTVQPNARNRVQPNAPNNVQTSQEPARRPRA